MRTPLLLLLFPATLSAQGRCIDSLGGANWRAIPLRSAVVAPVPGERDIDRYTAGILPLVAAEYHDPTERLQASARMITVPSEAERRAITAAVQVTFGRDGKLLGAALSQSSGIAMVDSAIMEAVRAAGSRKGFGRVPRKFRGDTLAVTLAVSDRHPASTRSEPLGNFSTSYLVADVPPRIRSMPPARAARNKRGNKVVLAATVNAAGRVVPGTIRVISTTDSTLVPIARRSFEQTTFRPGTKNGCPAEADIRLNFPF